MTHSVVICWKIPKWVEEALMTHSVVIHAMMVSWYLRGRLSNPIDDFMMNIDPWKYLGMV